MAKQTCSCTASRSQRDPGTLSSLPVTLIEELQGAGQLKAVRKLRGKRLGRLQPLPQTLRAWALLQLDGPPRACRAASARLASAARNKSFREKVRWCEEGRWQPRGYTCDSWGSAGFRSETCKGLMLRRRCARCKRFCLLKI